MATGKGKKGDIEANPFSFKNFVTGGPPQSGDFVSDEEDVQPFPDVNAIKSKPKAKIKKSGSKSSKITVVAPGPVEDLFADPVETPLASAVPVEGAGIQGANAGKKGDKKNPFSFTSFVKKEPTSPLQTGGGSSDDDWASSSSEVAGAPLPSRPLATTGLPTPKQNIFSQSDDDDDDDNDDDDEESSEDGRAAVHGLLAPGPGPVAPSSLVRQDRAEALLLQLEKLQEENVRLVAQLTVSEERAASEKKRCQKLKKQLAEQQKREKEETAVLEQAVQVVEKNLETSTTRAITAEKKVEKLKQQLAAAKANSMSDQVAAHHAQQLAAIRQKGENASTKLVATAQTAEKSIRDLLSGVENLKFVAELLASIDRFAEVPPGVD